MMLTEKMRWSLTAVWLTALAIGLALTADRLTGPAMLLFGAIGIIPPIVMLVLSKEAPRTTSQMIRDVDAS